jgi:hypothetical protein
MADELAHQTSPVTELPPADRSPVPVQRLFMAIGLCCLLVYGFACVRGWIGFSYTPISSPDGRYAASVFSKSPFFIPLRRTYTVQIASYRDRESHTVFEKTGIEDNFSVAWQGAGKLMIECGNCSGTELVQPQVDSIQIKLAQ